MNSIFKVLGYLQLLTVQCYVLKRLMKLPQTFKKKNSYLQLNIIEWKTILIIIKNYKILNVKKIYRVPCICSGYKNYKRNDRSDVMDTPEQDVYTVYKKLYEAMIEKDTDTIDNLMMDGSVLVHMTGVRQPKREWLRAIEDESMKYYSTKEENIEIILKEKKAKLVAQNKVDARIYGSRNTCPLELTMSMVKFEEDWKISHIEASTY